MRPPEQSSEVSQKLRTGFGLRISGFRYRRNPCTRATLLFQLSRFRFRVSGFRFRRSVPEAAHAETMAGQRNAQREWPSTYNSYSAAPSIRPVCTRCCFTMTDMSQVCSNFHSAKSRARMAAHSRDSVAVRGEVSVCVVY